MAQINFSIKDELNKKVEEISNELGLAKSDYIKSLIIEDLKKYLYKQNKK
jgi:predicted DNA-binding protein